MINQLKGNDKYGIPRNWRIFFILLLLTSLSLFIIPDSVYKGHFIQAVGLVVVLATLGSFIYKKHSLFPWVFLLIGSTLFGVSLTLLFLTKVGIPISNTLISLLLEAGVILTFIFSYSVILTYEKRLNLTGLTIDLGLLTISLVIFFLFAHPTIFNTFLYDLNIVQKTYWVNVLLSALTLLMAILINILYRGKRVQLLLLIPASTIVFIQFIVKKNEALNALGSVQYSPLSSELFILAGVVMSVFTFTESFSDHSIAEDHLEIQGNFTLFSNKLMWVAIVFSIVAIPIASIARTMLSLPEISVLLTIAMILIGIIIAGVRFMSIIKKLQMQQQNLLTITHTDKLTGLLNYAGFYDSLLRQNFHTLLIVFINIDDFKSVNDYYGRKFGDHVLIELARKLKKIPDSISCASIGADNFIIAFKVEEKHAKKRIAFLIKELGAWDTVLNKKIAVPLAFGACYKSDAKKLETKIGYAERALAKARRKHLTYHLFEQTDNQQKLPIHELKEILQEAIDNNHLPIHFQPIYNIDDGSLKALEVLIRIESEKYGMLLPGQFIEQAQSYGLLVDLTKVCISMVAEYYDYLPKVIININLPPFILKNPEILTSLVRHVKSVGLEPKQLCFEITEDESIRAEDLVSQVKYLTDNEFSIAMDDFGTGYSSLERLSLISFDDIKIDRSLLLAASNGDKTILESAIGLIKRLNESVVVEGVETLNELALIKKLGADSVQGFLLSKPIPIYEMTNLPKTIPEALIKSREKRDEIDQGVKVI